MHLNNLRTNNAFLRKEKGIRFYQHLRVNLQTDTLQNQHEMIWHIEIEYIHTYISQKQHGEDYYTYCSKCEYRSVSKIKTDILKCVVSFATLIASLNFHSYDSNHRHVSSHRRNYRTLKAHTSGFECASGGGRGGGCRMDALSFDAQWTRTYRVPVDWQTWMWYLRVYF